MTTTQIDWFAEYVKERNKVLLLTDQIVRDELGNMWTIEEHMELKTAILHEIDHEQGNK
jgi:hypothetical protein